MNSISGFPDMTKLSDRFYGFHDSLLRRIEFGFLAPSGDEQARVVISARDGQLADDWVNVEFYLDRLVEYKLKRHRSDIKVLSSGIRFAVIDNSIFLGFSPWCDEPETFDEFRRSDFYAVAAECHWFVAPYDEA